MAQSVRVDAVRVLASLSALERRLPKDVQKELRTIAKPVVDDTRRRLGPYSGRTAVGVRARAGRTGSVWVEQSTRKTTGYHPTYGELQMTRGFVPALEANEEPARMGLERLVSSSIRSSGLF